MNRIILWVLQTEIGRRTEIQILMNLVTSALRLPNINLLFTPSGKALDAFADFTAKKLERCKEEQREAVVMTEIKGLSIKEAAELMGVAQNTFLSRKHYAILYLRKRLQGLYEELVLNK